MSQASAEESSALSRYLREIRAFPRLTRDEEQQLFLRLERGDQQAAARLVECNLGFVTKVATEYRSLGVPFEELLNEGNLGLIEAARRYDRKKGTKFITYAVWWIRKAILKAIADRALIVRIPAYQRKRVYDVKKAEKSLTGRLGRAPTREEVARHLAMNAAQVDRARRLRLSEISLDRNANEDDSAPMVELLTDGASSIEDRMLSEEAGLSVMSAFRRLTPREQAVLGWRLALGAEPPLNLRQIAGRLGVSRERVRQIECQAKNRLRRLMAARTRR